MKNILFLFFLFTVSPLSPGQMSSQLWRTGAIGNNPTLLTLNHFNDNGGTKLHNETQAYDEWTINNCVWVTGKFGYALNFNGINSYCNYPFSSAITTEEFTVFISFRMDSVPASGGTLFAVNRAGGGGVGCLLNWNNDTPTKFYFQIAATGSCSSRSFPLSELTTWKWHRMAAVIRDDKSTGKNPLEIWLDGDMIARNSNLAFTFTIPTQGFYWGDSFDGAADGGLYLTGSLDEGATYLREFTAGEIKADYLQFMGQHVDD